MRGNARQSKKKKNKKPQLIIKKEEELEKNSHLRAQASQETTMESYLSLKRGSTQTKKQGQLLLFKVFRRRYGKTDSKKPFILALMT